jgi:hypothetical protein
MAGIAQPMQMQGRPLPATPGGYGSPSLNWQDILNAVVHNAPPGTPPELIARAVSKAIPLMNAVSAQQWKEISLQMREQTLLNAEDRNRRANENQQLARGQIQLSPAQEQEAAQIAAGQRAPYTGIASSRGIPRAIMDRVYEIKPDYNELNWKGGVAGTQAGARTTATGEAKLAPAPGAAPGSGATLASAVPFETRLGSGQFGKTAVSLNVLSQHLQDLRQVSKALENRDVKFLNSIRNKFREEFGSELPTNFAAVRGLVSDELVKAVTGGAGAVFDRAELRDEISSS